jgi:predicted O-methyltransferase YrrM
LSSPKLPSLLLTLAEIERHLHEGGGWCDLDKAQGLAALVWALRPSLVVEIGIWTGGSMIPMLIALRDLGAGQAIAIDPWNAEASIAGEAPENVEWWGGQVGQGGHERALECFRGRLRKHGLEPICHIWRQRSDDTDPPTKIDMIHIDGNHTEQAVRDVSRFAPEVRDGGILVLDDLEWAGGGVGRARDLAVSLGFVELYRLGSGCVMQRTAPR